MQRRQSECDARRESQVAHWCVGSLCDTCHPGFASGLQLNRGNRYLLKAEGSPYWTYGGFVSDFRDLPADSLILIKCDTKYIFLQWAAAVRYILSVLTANALIDGNGIPYSNYSLERCLIHLSCPSNSRAEIIWNDGYRLTGVRKLTNQILHHYGQQ